MTKTVPELYPLLEQEVQNLLEKGAICEVPFCEDGFYSRLFVIPKRDGSMRPVIDLSPLNHFIDTPHFQMENLATVKSLLRQGHFMTKIDLKDAYFSVAIHPQSQKFLRFLWQNKAFQFCSLPFGLNIAPSLFTRLMKPVAGFLRKRGVRLILYLDDMLIIGSTPREVNDFTQMAVNLLKALGFIINLDKSVLTPTQVITFLGFTINSITMRFTLPSEKVQKLLTLCRQIRSSSKVLLRTLAQLLGLLESYRLAVWQAPLHFRYLQALLIRGLNQMNHNYEAPVSLCAQSLGEINWWLQNLETVNGSPIITPSSDLTIFTDASLTGWGAACGNIQTNGKWSATERQLHINVLELKRAMLGIQSLLKNQSSKIISLNMDSSTAVAYINHKGGTHSPELLQVALQLWNWCIQRNLFIIVYHVPGKTNVVADRESREFIDNSDWKVDPIIISPFLRGCSTDLFASRLTHQLARYISWRPDPQAFKADAFSVNWKHLKGYAFPPFNLIARVLDKVMMDKTDLVLVAPIWQAQPWWPLLLGMMVQQPVLLPSSSTLLIDPTDPQHIHPMFPRLHLGVFHISSNDIRQRAFRETLPNYSSQQLEIPHRKHTSPAGNASAAGVIGGKLILFQHL